MDEETNVLGTDQTSTEQNDNTQKEEKTFTQDEVNRIVESRLKRERDKLNAEPNPKEVELAQREQKIHEREMRLNASELLKDEGLPVEFIDLLNLKDDDTCSQSIEIAHKIHKAITGQDRKPTKWGKEPSRGGSLLDLEQTDEQIREIFTSTLE